MSDGWKLALSIAGFTVLICACTSPANSVMPTRESEVRNTAPTLVVSQKGLGVSRETLQRRYEALGLEFNAPRTLADGRRSVTGSLEIPTGVEAAVELIGPADDLTEVAVITAASEAHARRYLPPVLVEVLEFAPEQVEKSSSNMLIGATRGKAIALQGVSRPVVGELSVTPELGLLFLTVEAAN